MEVHLTLVAEAARAEPIAAAVFDRIAALEAILSDWRVDSELRRLSAAPAGVWMPVSQALRDVLAVALAVAEASDGAFDPTVGALSARWREARRSGRPIDPRDRVEARGRIGYRDVALDSAGSRVRLARTGMALDLGGVAKGCILDEALSVVRSLGADAAMLEAGGDLVVHGAPRGQPGWRIAVPRAHGDTVLVLRSGAVSTSGPVAQQVRDTAGAIEGHVIDPRTGRGAAAGAAVTVVGPRGCVTDAVATALTLLDAEAGARLADRFGVRVVAPATAAPAPPPAADRPTRPRSSSAARARWRP
jgi:thiamine biosynthesis lipoprotein